MNENMLLPVISNREKTSSPFSLNDRGTEHLNNSTIDELNQP